jgi:hypothetical protein
LKTVTSKNLPNVPLGSKCKWLLSHSDSVIIVPLKSPGTNLEE